MSQDEEGIKVRSLHLLRSRVSQILLVVGLASFISMWALGGFAGAEVQDGANGTLTPGSPKEAPVKKKEAEVSPPSKNSTAEQKKEVSPPPKSSVPSSSPAAPVGDDIAQDTPSSPAASATPPSIEASSKQASSDDSNSNKQASRNDTSNIETRSVSNGSSLPLLLGGLLVLAIVAGLSWVVVRRFL